MMVGHALLAFSLVALATTRLGWSGERALAAGAVAGVFATVPDVDMAYALVGLARAGFGGVGEMAAAFWGSSTLVHRAVTHSIPVAAVAAVAFVWSTRGRTRRLLAAATFAGLIAVALVESGALGAGVMAVFVLAGTAVAAVAARRTDLGPRALLAAALVGLLSHPFGDLFTGEPPAFLYPLDLAPVSHRLALHPDPTLNLLAVFGMELVTMWLAVHTLFRLTDRRFRSFVEWRAAVGAAYAAAAVVLPAPTLSVSYHFVFSVLAVGVVGVAPRLRPLRGRLPADRSELATCACTGLTAITLATVAYTAAYLVA